ncbi:amidase [Rubrobacter aplysinae]|uniref:amidase n=1 Tax=Rubrobacter aplysinae TaxID=909625 RepID=UPI00064BF256|nr:amidase [Rubrobacter aplysinae]
MTETAFLTAAELGRLYRDRELSPVEATRAALDQIEEHNPRVNAFCLVDEEAALASARESEKRYSDGGPLGKLDGVPASIKDLVLTRGWPTLRGSRLVDPDQAWEEDAPSTARLREGGAVLLGKTTTPEYGWKGVTDSPLTGVTTNPWDTTRTSGGSSGGAAAAISLGMGRIAIGTDGGGSVRIPGAFCGIFGFKATFGRVPAWPISPFGTLANVGPMTSTVEDAALMMDVISAPDYRDPLTLPPAGYDFADHLEGGVEGLRVAFSPDLGYAELHPEVRDAVEQAARAFEELGATVVREDPGFDDPVECFKAHWYPGAAKALAAYGREARALMDPGLVEIVEEGERYSAVEHLEAVAKRGELGILMGEFHRRYDLLLTPTMPIPAFEAGVETPGSRGSGGRWTSWASFSHPFNLTQQPAATVPCGFAEGLPVGLQIVGARHADALVLRAARAYEAAHPMSSRPPLAA